MQLMCQTLCQLPKSSRHVINFPSICARRYLAELKQIVADKTKMRRDTIAKFRKEHGNIKVGEITINSIYGGMRGLLGLVYETSNVDPKLGVTFRGLAIPELREKLPKAECGDEPLPEGVFWLLLSAQVPTDKQVKALSCDWAERGAELPPYVRKMLNDMPKEMHPMRQLTCAVTALGNESKFNKAYNKGVKKADYWEWIYEDCMDLLAKLPVIAATIYVNTFHGGGKELNVDPNLDWSANYAKMMGFNKPEFDELMRLYLSIHCDHEGGNVSAHAMHLVGSALSDPFYSYAAGMNGLAGPLHGLANQEVLIWLTQMQKDLGKDASDAKVKEYCEKTLKSGKVIPGYGHAVLRVTDPRFTCQAEYAQKHLPNDPMFKLVTQLAKIVPPILIATGKVQNPYPNVDAHSGVLLQYYGLKEMRYYTVLFAVSRAIGGCASLILSREIGLPIERPKSKTTRALMDMVKNHTKP